MKQFCTNGHNTFVVGRYKNGGCKTCRSLSNVGYYSKHSEEIKATVKLYHNTHKEKRAETHKNWNIRRYGITPDTYRQLVLDQNGKCAICDKPYENLSIDHSHTTGKVRGLLCQSCNARLGVLEDKDFVEKSKLYLKEC